MHEEQPVPGSISPSDINLSIVLPAYNEELSIEDAVRDMLTLLPQIVKDHELVIVDDGSSDGTGVILRELAARHAGITVVRHESNLGYGAALRTGFAHARMEWVLFTDADLQIRASELPRFLHAAGTHDMVIGFRKGRRDSITRRLLSKSYGLLISAVLGVRVRDINCPFKLFRRTLIGSLNLVSRGFFINAELLYKAGRKGFRITERDVHYSGRQKGRLTVRFRHAGETVAELISLLRNTGTGIP